MKTESICAITGITGQVGGSVARPLLAASHPIRAVVREAGKGAPWAERGCEVAVAEWDVTPARETGLIRSFLQPLDKPVPMVATGDVGRVAAELLQETWSGRRILELEGPHRVTPNEIAFTFSKILGPPVRTEAIPRESWATLFESQGMKNPTPRIRMLDGFNEGWIEFEKGETGTQKGKVSLETVLKALVETN